MVKNMLSLNYVMDGQIIQSGIGEMPAKIKSEYGLVEISVGVPTNVDELRKERNEIISKGDVVTAKRKFYSSEDGRIDGIEIYQKEGEKLIPFCWLLNVNETPMKIGGA